jgi:hypothetical protein
VVGSCVAALAASGIKEIQKARYSEHSKEQQAALQLGASLVTTDIRDNLPLRTESHILNT